ncbi:MAG: alpha/beta hydrolase [Lachnospiraceae bacterium]|nr:alpha/beta hydrolase [Lachnospiraceae bacterium]
MINREAFSIKSANEVSQLAGMKWVPSVTPIAVLQICHGMKEHLIRYDEFAEFLAERGILVVAVDLPGHGHSVKDESELGYFGDEPVNARLVEDLFRTRTYIQKEYSHLPYFIMGHSMGSIIVRDFILMHHDGLAGVILMGCVDYSTMKCKSGKVFLTMMSLLHLKRFKYRSVMADHMGLATFDKPYKNEKIRNTWLSRDKEEVEKFNQDPLCNYTYALQVYKVTLNGMLMARDPEKLAELPEGLPMLVVSGTDDSAGEFGKAPKKVARIYRANGLKVILRMYKNARHELLHELNREQVYGDILKWINHVM